MLHCEDGMQDEGVGVAGVAIYPGKQTETRGGMVDPGYTPPDRIGARLADIFLS